uniref:thioredoxin domain-containing protein 11 isoform X2 n=1 Tax=Ciona intestinalis TaxID=7719 RepID=UPI0005213211|nr:thioredoxin domain-containing protein 11 isoform X2 [Ciona intestinalis]|eukprot:XP_009861822.1 thioredoxin domain-containing protein 11 isoform X2 [Ciona intestinalis]
MVTIGASKIIKTMQKRPETIILILTFVFFIQRLWDGVHSSPQTRSAPQPTPIITHPPIHDLPTGSLVHLQYLLSISEISLVLYYAPWCERSFSSVKELNKTAQVFHKQVSFVAINCWWDQGECRGNNNFQSFPHLYLHHRSLKTPVHYNGPHTHQYFARFVSKVLSPFTYLGTLDVVEGYLNNGKTSIIASAGVNLTSNELLQQFLQISLQSLSKFPSWAIQMGLITSPFLHTTLGMKEGYMRIYNGGRGVGEISLNSTWEVVEGWMEKKKDPIVVPRILSSGQKSNLFFQVLNKGPTLVAFLPSLDDVTVFEEINTIYNKNCHQVSTHCSSIVTSQPSICNVCLQRDSHPRTPHNEEIFFRRLLKLGYFEALATQSHSCVQSRSFYDKHRTRLNICCGNIHKNHTKINGLGCRSNCTLQFLMVDSTQYPALATAVKVDDTKSNAVIIDIHNEMEYLMKGSFTKQNIVDFILEFTSDRLRNTRKVYGGKVGGHEDVLQLKEFTVKDFIDMIDHQNTKDTLVYHHSPYCGFCSQYSHQLISFKRLLRGVRNLDIVSVSSDTNSQLPLTFQAISFPTLMFYPANRSSDSTRYPPHVQLTPSKLMGFLWHYASPLTKLQIVVALCDDHSTSKQYSCFSAFMENLEICKLTGIMKSLFPA